MNAYVWALVLTTGSSMLVWNELMAVAVAAVSVIVPCSFRERHYVDAISARAVKG